MKSSLSCSMIRYYRGTDWFLEEHDDVSYSYQLLSQEQGQGYLYYSVKKMETDWIGSDLLNELDVPYTLYQESNGWQWEKVGVWYRCICPDTGKSVGEQWSDACKWVKSGICPPATVPVPVTAPVPVPAPAPAPAPAPVTYHPSRGREEYRNRDMRGDMRGRGRGRGQGRGRGRGRDRGNTGV